MPAFQVVLILTSFVLAWFEAWFLDGRVIPQEQFAQNIPQQAMMNSERSPLINPSFGNAESISNYHSPYASLHGSEDGCDMDYEYRRMGLECVRKSHELLECPNWKLEKVTAKGDKISSSKRDGLGKVYKLTATVRCSAKALIYELFTKVEDVPKWNPTLLESRVIHKIDYYTDISYQASVGGGGGLVKSRDFVNLRCFGVVENGRLVSEQELKAISKGETIKRPERRSSLSTVHEQSEGEGSSVKSVASVLNESYQTQSVVSSVGNSISGGNFAGVVGSYGEATDGAMNEAEGGGMESRGGREGDEDVFSDCDNVNRIYISSAKSVVYPGFGPCPKYERGENIISCWATRSVDGHPNECLFEWLLCLDLKGYIMASVLDTAYKKLMQDYMEHLRKHFER